jgi:hypothetical protein
MGVDDAREEDASLPRQVDDGNAFGDWSPPGADGGDAPSADDEDAVVNAPGPIHRGFEGGSHHGEVAGGEVLRPGGKGRESKKQSEAGRCGALRLTHGSSGKRRIIAAGRSYVKETGVVRDEH